MAALQKTVSNWDYFMRYFLERKCISKVNYGMYAQDALLLYCCVFVFMYEIT
ncbi:hypothetical protein HMPREF9554_03017 [Treponema phagedenis F0421]|nr:hypothetical protein HMPREF9554_03017 [Treponema phagedenis F0421]